MRTFLLLALTLLLATPALAQQARILDDAWCDAERTYWSDDDSKRYCEVREILITDGRERIAVDAGKNGGIRVEGWNRDEIRLRVKVVANARTEAAAEELARAVTIETGATIHPEVPEARRRAWASVSFELMVPRRSDLALETHNGGISIAAVAGDVTFRALNGGVELVDLAGRIQGHTTNGGLEIHLTGTEWQGDGLDVETTNGGVELVIPDGYSARLETGTVNGKLYFDFPVTVQGRLDRRLEADLGRGGRTIRAVTTNGGVEVRRS